MTRYHRILLAIDLDEHSVDVASRAAGLANAMQAHVDIVHVLDHVVGDYPADVVGSERMDKLDLVKVRAREQMTALVERFTLTDFDLLVEAGTTREVILRVAGERRSDLIVIGAHERHGIALMRGSMIERIRDAAHCDVLAVTASTAVVPEESEEREEPAVPAHVQRASSSAAGNPWSPAVPSTLKEVLKQKESGATIHSVAVDATVDEAITAMNQKGIGAVLVMYDENLVGIFTERDVLTKVASRKLDPRTTPLADVMTKNVLALDPTATVEYAMRVITEKRFRHLPVTEDGKLIGVLSSGDLTRWVVRDQEDTIDDLIKYISGDMG